MPYALCSMRFHSVGAVQAHREHERAGGLVGQGFQLAMQLDAAHADFLRKILNTEL